MKLYNTNEKLCKRIQSKIVPYYLIFFFKTNDRPFIFDQKWKKNHTIKMNQIFQRLTCQT